MRLTFDTNVLVHAADRKSEHHDAAANLVARAAVADCVQTLQSFSECYHVLRRKRRIEVGEARRMLLSFQSIFVVAAAIPADLDVALDMVERHRMAFWDALLGATARRAGCRLILTEDGQDGQRLEDLLYVNPFEPGNARLLDLALPSIDGSSP